MRISSHSPLLLSLALLVAGTVSCSLQKQEEDVGGYIQVQIPFTVNGKYSLQIIELFTVKSLTDFRGGAAQFLMDPDTSSGELRGRNPQLRYMRNNDGVIIPKDPLSLQLLTVYAHLERLQSLDEEVGAKDVLAYPRQVAINANYRSSSGPEENNAVYSGQYDALLLVPYSLEDLPIMANGGVLAHEHFHALFQRILIEPLGKSYPVPILADPNQTKEAKARDQYHGTILRGLNEGLADAWGWIYSGETNFVRQSLPRLKASRSLDTPLGKMISSSDAQKLIVSTASEKDPNSEGVSYALGNQVARAIRGLAPFMAKHLQISEDQVRPLIGKLILQALPELRKKFSALTPSQKLAPGEVLLIMAEKIPDLSAGECTYLAGLVETEDKKDSTIDQKCEALKPPAEKAPVVVPSKGRR